VAEDSLEQLITQCPTCRTRFRVTKAQLEIAAGRVRCGACLSVFVGLEHLVLAPAPGLPPGESANDALDALLEELRTEPKVDRTRAQSPNPPSQRPVAHADRTKPVGNRASTEVLGPTTKKVGASQVTTAVPTGRDAIHGGPIDAIDQEPTEAPQEPVAAGTSALSAVSSRRARRLKASQRSATGAPAASIETEVPLPVVRVPAAVALDIDPDDILVAPRRRRRRWWVPLALLLGVGLLTAQVLYLQFDEWSKNPQFRPVYEWLCPRLGCQLPVMRALDQIYSKNLVVRDNPAAPGTLMVDALIVNQASFAQPFPVIELRFSSMEGSPITARQFRPEEYLAGELKGATLIAPRTPVHIALEIEDPGNEAVNYVLRFR
jgi:predicted Zn finger-like uncharacterized protein